MRFRDFSTMLLQITQELRQHDGFPGLITDDAQAMCPVVGFVRCASPGYSPTR